MFVFIRIFPMKTRTESQKFFQEYFLELSFYEPVEINVLKKE